MTYEPADLSALIDIMKYDEAISFEKLYESMKKCKCGVAWKDSVAHFILNAPELTEKLEKELGDGTYKPRKVKKFRITSPKPRDIVSVTFRDRVYQRSLNDNILYPAVANGFIYDNWACQKKKGSLNARKRFEELLRRYYRKHGNTGWVAQFDIHGYYPNMRHDVVEKYFHERLDDKSFEAVKNVLRSQYEGDKGYNPGSQMVQIAGISCLDKLDHYIKERLHIKIYIRYMDDFVIVHEDKSYVEECVEKIKDELSKIGFEVNEKKTKMFPLEIGIRFLGFDFHLTDTGKVLKFIRPDRVKAEIKKLRRLVAKAKRGEIPKEQVDASYQSWRNHAAYGNSRKLLVRMDVLYHNMWSDDNV